MKRFHKIILSVKFIIFLLLPLIKVQSFLYSSSPNTANNTNMLLFQRMTDLFQNLPFRCNARSFLLPLSNKLKLTIVAWCVCVFFLGGGGGGGGGGSVKATSACSFVEQIPI